MAKTSSSTGLVKSAQFPWRLPLSCPSFFIGRLAWHIHHSRIAFGPCVVLDPQPTLATTPVVHGSRTALGRAVNCSLKRVFVLEQYDYVIVGAGTAGCVLANRLSASGEHSVLLVEAGGRDTYFWIDIPVGYLYTIANPRTDWCYQTEPDQGLNGRSIGYARGKGLGGCSSINAMIYMRGQASDYDHWRQLGNEGWSWDDVLPVFKRSEDYQHGADDFHGSGGELRVEERRVNWEILDAWRDAAEECGIPKIEEFNRGDNFGNAYFQMTQRTGKRWNAVRALDPAKARPNLTVVTDAHVKRIVLKQTDSGLRATGIEARLPDGSRPVIQARRETILSAGAIGSPQLLQLSGVGNADHLNASGLSSRHHLPGVGKTYRTICRFEPSTR